MTEKGHALALCRQIAEDYKMPLYVYKNESSEGMFGCAYFDGSDRIHLYLGKNNVDLIMSIFFHEMAHIYCRRNRIYPHYHGLGTWKQVVMARKHHGMQAERYVDKLGQKLAKIYFGNNFKCLRAYDSKEDVEWYNEKTRKMLATL